MGSVGAARTGIEIKQKATSFDDVTLLYKRFLRLIAILPFEGRDFSFSGTRCLFAYYFTSSVVHWTMFVLYIINSKGILTVETICETVMVMGLNARYYLLIPHRREFNDLVEECRQIWEAYDEEGQLLVRQFEHKMRKLFQFLLGSCICTNIMYSLSAISFTLAAARINATRRLPYKWYTEDTENMWPGYKTTFGLQVLMIQNASIIATSVDSAAPFLIMFGAGYFKALKNRLFRIPDDEHESETADLELVACSRLHQRILNFCLRIDKITRTLFFVQLLCTGYNTSLIGVKLAGSDPDRYKYVSLGLFNLIQLFICQWAPDYLIDESESMSTATYYVSFTWMRRRIGKHLVLIIARSQRPVQMTAGGIVKLSLENFGSMLTSAISFFTILRNFSV